MTDTDWRNPHTQALFRAILTIETEDEASDFFRDLCTVRELEDMGQRWAVVRLLDEGHSYREISDLSGASTATITRINQWFTRGTGGYRMILERVSAGS
jgi:TrpR-related protein YerC/YecD